VEAEHVPDRYWPVGQAVVQGVHTRLLVVVQFAVMYWPVEQVAQFAHTRLVDTVQAVVSYWVAVQVLQP
jgi:hypothetical protein